MMTFGPDPWGISEPPATGAGPLAPLPLRLARMAALTEPEVVADFQEWSFPRAEELPEVAALMAQGWYPLDDGAYGLLPAVWPAALRCWVPDRRPGIVTMYDGVTRRVLPAAVAPDRRRMVDPTAAAAELAGLPAAPADRIWLLRSPWPWLGLRVVLSLIDQRQKELATPDPPVDLGVANQLAAAAELLTWDDTRVRRWWTGGQAESAAAWEAAGRTGADVAELIIWRLGPTELAQSPGLTESQTLCWCRSVGLRGPAAVARIELWRRLGLPADPPPNLYRFADWSADQIEGWLTAGFDIATMVDLISVPLVDAIAWRAHGYRTAEIVQLTAADPVLTPAEADAFTDLGIVGERQLSWIERGFQATEAAAFIARDVQPNEARVWRSMGLNPADVQPGQTLPAGYVRGAWIGPNSVPMRDYEHGVADPPDTRGGFAARARERAEQHARRPRRRRGGEPPGT